MPYIDILPTKAAVFDYWKDRLGSLRIFIDWGEPSCWACRFHYGTKYDIKRSDANWEEILRAWESIPLQRCHIVPRSLGGSDHCHNLFLMCRECHDLAPNTNIPEIFFHWARRQSSWKRESQKLDNAFEAFDLTDSEKHEIVRTLKDPEFDLWSQGRVGFHRPQSNYAPKSARMTPATLIGLAIYYERTVRAGEERAATCSKMVDAPGLEPGTR